MSHCSLRLLLLLLFVSVQGDEDSACVDTDVKCSQWATQGECQTNAAWMMANCRRSCHSCQGGDRAWKLRTHLASVYDNGTNNVTLRSVSIESVRLNHLDIDESKQMVKASGKMVLSWNDSRVSWDKDQWGLSWLNFYWIQIWTPQIVQLNSFVFLPISSSFRPANTIGTVSGKVLAANYTGRVYMWADFAFALPYTFNYAHYPNDYQRVCFKFDDKRYLTVRFKVTDEVKSQSREELTESHVSGWLVDRMEMKDSVYALELLGDFRKDPYDVQSTNAELCLGLQRNAVFYVTEMLMPALLTAALTLSSALFGLSVAQGALLAVSFIGQMLALTMISTRLPTYASTAPTILRFAAFNLISTTFLFIVSLILKRISSSTSHIPPPHSMERFFSLIDRIVPRLADEKTTAVDDSAYSPIARSVNNLIFLLFILLYLIAIAICFVF